MADFDFEEEEFDTRFDGRTLLRVLAQARPHWPWLAGFLAAVIAVSILDSVFTYLKKLIIDVGIVPGNVQRLTEVIGLYGALSVVSAAGVFSFILMAALLSERIQYDLRRKMFNHLQELSFSYFDRTPVGWIISRVTSDSSRMADLITWGLLDVTWATMSIASASVFMFWLHWKMALVVFLTIPVLVWVAALFKRKIIVEYRQ